MADRSRPDQNNNFSQFAVSNADGTTPVSLWADPTTHSLLGSVTANGNTAIVTALGQLSVSIDPSVLFIDTFDGAVVDTTNRWTLSGTVNPTQSGAILVNPSTTGNATSAINSQYSFPGGVNQAFGVFITLETTIATGNHRFWGRGVPPSVPGTAAAPLQDAIGFEIDTSGVLRASVYASGTRVYTQALTVPTDGLPHLYIISENTGTTLFYKDSLAAPIASTQTLPNVQTLPIRIASLNSGTVTGTPTISGTSLGSVDYAHQAQGIQDGTYYWRKATVSAAGQLSTSLSDGTNTASVLKSDGTAAAQNSQLVAGTYLSTSFTTTTPQAVGTTDVGNYRYVSVQFTSQGGSASNTFQVSNDNTNWVNLPLQISTSTTGAASSLGNAVALYQGPLMGRYFRINATAIVSGTTAGVIIFSTLPTVASVVGTASAQNGTWTVGANSPTGSAVPANAFYIAANNDAAQLGGLSTAKRVAVTGLNNTPGDTSLSVGVIAQYNTSAPAPTAGNFSNLQTDSGANLKVSIAGGMVPQSTALNTYSVHITTNTTTTPTAATAYISSIVISVPTSGTTSTVTIKDKQATALTLISAFSTAAALAGGDAIYNYTTPVKMTSGIDIITAGAAAATVDIWINFYQ